LYNYGTLATSRGTVQLGSRSDYLLNEGVVISPLASRLGGGNDFYDGRLGSLVGDGDRLGHLAGGAGTTGCSEGRRGSCWKEVTVLIGSLAMAATIWFPGASAMT
jgi:hypothetical protein